MSNIRVNYLLLPNGKVHRFPIGEMPRLDKKKIPIDDSIVMIACNSIHLGEYWVRMPYVGYLNWHKIKKQSKNIKFEYTFVMDYEQWEEYENVERYKETFNRPNIESFMNDIVLYNAKITVFNSMLWMPSMDYNSYFANQEVTFKTKSDKKKKVLLTDFLQWYLMFSQKNSLMYHIPGKDKKRKNFNVDEERWKSFNKKLKEGFNLIQIPDSRIPIYISASKRLMDVGKIKIDHCLYMLDSPGPIVEDYDSSELGDMVVSAYGTTIKSYDSPNLAEYFYFKMYEFAFHELGIMNENNSLQLRSKLKIKGKLKRLPFHIPDPYAARVYKYKFDDKSRIVLEKKNKKPEPIKLVWKIKENDPK